MSHLRKSTDHMHPHMFWKRFVSDEPTSMDCVQSLFVPPVKVEQSFAELLKQSESDS